DTASRKAGAGLASPAPWSGTGVRTVGAGGAVVWGLCAGGGKKLSRTVGALAGAEAGKGPGYKCSCPSRKFPCKHALGLLLLWAQGGVPGEAEPADYARAGLGARPGKGAKSGG